MEKSFAKLGKEGRDIVTDYKGLVTAVCFYWGGNSRLGLTPKATWDKPAKEEWFDEARVEITEVPVFPKDRK